MDNILYSVSGIIPRWYEVAQVSNYYHVILEINVYIVRYFMRMVIYTRLRSTISLRYELVQLEVIAVERHQAM